MKIDLGEDFTYNLTTKYKDLSLSEAMTKAAFIDLESQIRSLTDENKYMRINAELTEHKQSTESYLETRVN